MRHTQSLPDPAADQIGVPFTQQDRPWHDRNRPVVRRGVRGSGKLADDAFTRMGELGSDFALLSKASEAEQFKQPETPQLDTSHRTCVDRGAEEGRGPPGTAAYSSGSSVRAVDEDCLPEISRRERASGGGGSTP